MMSELTLSVRNSQNEAKDKSRHNCWFFSILSNDMETNMLTSIVA
jgi:hypothetical protein